MIYPVWQHFAILSVSLAVGFVLALVFDIKTAMLLLLHGKSRVISDIVLWILLALAVFRLWAALFDGAFRIIYLLWFALGYALYAFTCGKPLSVLAARHVPKTSPYIKTLSLFGRADNMLLNGCRLLCRRLYAALRAAKVYVAATTGRVSAFLHKKAKKDEKI